MDVRINDNKLVLVGENGTGKSTFANLIYYFLTRQWQRLHDYRFSAIEAVLDDQELKVIPEQIETHFAARQQITLAIRRLSPPHRLGRGRSPISRLLEYPPQTLLEHRDELALKISDEEGIPVRMARELINNYLHETKGKPTELQVTEEKISALVEG
jgi:hypothetical protein